MARRISISSIGRPVDLRVRTNQVIAIETLAVMAVAAIVRVANGASTLDGAKHGIVAGAAVFLAWAISRELDPDAPWGAFLAPVFAFAHVLASDSASALYGFSALLALRFVNRSTGPAATMLDSAIAVVVALILVNQGLWAAGLAMAVALGLDALLSPRNQKQWIAVVVAMGGTLWIAGVPSLAGDKGLSIELWILLGLAAALMVPLILASRHVDSVGDRTGQPLGARRVQSARALAVVILSATIMAHGVGGVAASLPLWSAMLGVGGYRVISWLSAGFEGAR